MENKENNVQNTRQIISNNTTQQDDPVAKELAKPQKKRKSPLTVSAIFTVITLFSFVIYLTYMLATYQSINSGDAGATFVGALFLLPLAILIGLAVLVFAMVADINAIFAIPSDIKKVKIFGIVLTVLNILVIATTIILFFILINV